MKLSTSPSPISDVHLAKRSRPSRYSIAGIRKPPADGRGIHTALNAAVLPVEITARHRSILEMLGSKGGENPILPPHQKLIDGGFSNTNTASHLMMLRRCAPSKAGGAPYASALRPGCSSTIATRRVIFDLCYVRPAIPFSDGTKRKQRRSSNFQYYVAAATRAAP